MRLRIEAETQTGRQVHFVVHDRAICSPKTRSRAFAGFAGPHIIGKGERAKSVVSDQAYKRYKKVTRD